MLSLSVLYIFPYFFCTASHCMTKKLTLKGRTGKKRNLLKSKGDFYFYFFNISVKVNLVMFERHWSVIYLCGLQLWWFLVNSGGTPKKSIKWLCCEVKSIVLLNKWCCCVKGTLKHSCNSNIWNSANCLWQGWNVANPRFFQENISEEVYSVTLLLLLFVLFVSWGVFASK